MAKFPFNLQNCSSRFSGKKWLFASSIRIFISEIRIHLFETWILNNWMLHLSAVVLVLSCTRLAGFVSRGSLLGSSTIKACTHKQFRGKLFSTLLISLLTFPLHLLLHSLQCCGFVTFWQGYGAPYHWLTDPSLDPDPAFLSVADKMPTKNNFCLQSFVCLLLFEGI